MAELRAALTALETLEAHYEALQLYVDTLSSTISSLECIETLKTTLAALEHAVEGEVDVTMEKFRARSTMVDPVTNEPRFGPKTLAKVFDMLLRYDALKENVASGEVLRAARKSIEAFHMEQQAHAQRLEQQQRQAEQAKRKRQQEQAEQQQREEEARQAAARRAQELEQARIAELARLAQQKRMEREQQRLAEEVRARDEQERLKQQNASVQVGVEGLQDAISTLETNLGDPTTFRRVLQKLHVLIGNVCAAPEKTEYRHIPKDNAHFHQDIGQYQGGHECLLTMGFKELEPELTKRVFIMEEPDLSEDLDRWSAWFDGLKDMKEFLEQRLL